MPAGGTHVGCRTSVALPTANGQNRLAKKMYKGPRCMGIQTCSNCEGHEYQIENDKNSLTLFRPPIFHRFLV